LNTVVPRLAADQLPVDPLDRGGELRGGEESARLAVEDCDSIQATRSRLVTDALRGRRPLLGGEVAPGLAPHWGAR
jgi:hypothetical protein